ncbi:hypothetical protein Q9233_001921 [Columba guinea]|nr:hypothetical protein Q9233_001921 [Columba guinea]
MMFRDQVGVLAGWFKGWNECEQTVALLSLLKRVSRTQARFLQLCLEHSLADCTELHILEGEANNPDKRHPTETYAGVSEHTRDVVTTCGAGAAIRSALKVVTLLRRDLMFAVGKVVEMKFCPTAREGEEPHGALLMVYGNIQHVRMQLMADVKDSLRSGAE